MLILDVKREPVSKYINKSTKQHDTKPVKTCIEKKMQKTMLILQAGNTCTSHSTF